MSLLSILTAVFVTLKLIGTIDWSWFWVLSPTIFQMSLWVLLIVGAAFATRNK